MAKRKNSLRIIGGAWRSRQIHFADMAIVRPTPDRVRETLFNWLKNKIPNADCLDLFAGSGALGFEAISRGASHVTMIESEEAAVRMLYEQKRILSTQRISIVHQDALIYLQQADQKFDIVFLDPPFGSELLQHSIVALVKRELVSQGGIVYVESPKNYEQPHCLDAFSCIREKTAGQVRYSLYKAPNKTY